MHLLWMSAEAAGHPTSGAWSARLELAQARWLTRPSAADPTTTDK